MGRQSYVGHYHEKEYVNYKNFGLICANLLLYYENESHISIQISDARDNSSW